MKIPGDPRTKEMQETAADKIIELLKNPEKTEEIRKSMELPVEETWENSAEKWQNLF